MYLPGFETLWPDYSGWAAYETTLDVPAGHHDVRDFESGMDLGDFTAMPGKLEIDLKCEDIHMFVEQVLTERIGAVGKKLHTARSRNDQVALDLRMYLRREIDTVSQMKKRVSPSFSPVSSAISLFCSSVSTFEIGSSLYL